LLTSPVNSTGTLASMRIQRKSCIVLYHGTTIKRFDKRFDRHPHQKHQHHGGFLQQWTLDGHTVNPRCWTGAQTGANSFCIWGETRIMDLLCKLWCACPYSCLAAAAHLWGRRSHAPGGPLSGSPSSFCLLIVGEDGVTCARNFVHHSRTYTSRVQQHDLNTTIFNPLMVWPFVLRRYQRNVGFYCWTNTPPPRSPIIGQCP
jgi:hypothetical protein